MQRLFQRWWYHFAASGSPNGPGLPPWAAYEPGQETLLHIADPVRSEANPRQRPNRPLWLWACKRLASMRIWLCDDEEVERSYLAALVEEWAKAQGVPLQLCVFSGAEALLFAQNGGPQATYSFWIYKWIPWTA